VFPCTSGALAPILTASRRISVVTPDRVSRALRPRITAHLPQTAFTLRSPSRHVLNTRHCFRRYFATSEGIHSLLEQLKESASRDRSGNEPKVPVHAHRRSQYPPTIYTESRILYDASSPSTQHYSRFAPYTAWGPLLEPVQSPANESSEHTYNERDRMSSSIEILTTPTSDTAGTTLVLRTGSKAYVFGSQGEGTQRAMVQQGTRLLKAQDFFLTGKAEWQNTGGFVGLMLTLADSTSSSFEQAMEVYRQAKQRGKKAVEPTRPCFNIYGPPNLKHTLGTCRRFIFRKGIPIHATEYRDKPIDKDDSGSIPPSWQDASIQVWALSVSPVGYQPDAQAEADLEARRHDFDTRLNTFEDHKAPNNESPEDREARYDRIRSATLKYMFDSNWSFDTLVERHISEVQMPAAMFVRDPNSQGYQPYTGPKPGGSEPLPDITVFTRTPWPGANILALPPTKPAPECVSYIVRTLPSRGVFDVARAKALGVKPGPNFGKLTNGQSVQNENGDWIEPAQVIGADRPGQGVAILDVPSVEYLEAIVQREELNSSDVMSGIGAIVWMLGPGVAGHPILNEFTARLGDVKHIISSKDVSPNRITYDSVSAQATRMAQIDPSRYSVPWHNNSTIPQDSLLPTVHHQVPSLPVGAVAADRGMTCVLMPKFIFKGETKPGSFDHALVEGETDAEVLRLAGAAQQAVVDDTKSIQAWRGLLARPDTEVITLGTGSALPSKYRNVSATLVKVPGVGNYLLDCGENTLGQLSRVFPPAELREVIKDLRLIWISHLHADHHLGTAGVIRAWYQLVHGGVPNREALNSQALNANSGEYGLSVISHSGMLQWLYEYSSVEDFGYSRILPLQITSKDYGHGSTLNILNSFNVEQNIDKFIQPSQYENLFGFADIQAAKVSHCHGSMAVSITFPPSSSDPHGIRPLKVSYSGDCRPSYQFAKVGRDTTVLIHEATFDDELVGDAKAKKHSTTSEALGIGAQMDATAVVLTHFSQRYQKIPVLQAVPDDESEDLLLLDTKATAEEANNEDDTEVDPTIENADNMDIHPTSKAAPKVPTLQHQGSSTFHENERVIKIRNRNMKVAIAFDYMRVKIGEIVQLEKFNVALNELLVKEDDVPAIEGVDESGDGMINKNGKKTSGDEGGGKSKKRSKRNN
jgi:ribonuclease Z